MDSKCFSIMSDEAADASNRENLSVVIRFLDWTKTVIQKFVGFYFCEDGTIVQSIYLFDPSKIATEIFFFTIHLRKVYKSTYQKSRKI